MREVETVLKCCDPVTKTAVITIQALIRGFLTRLEYPMFEEEDEEPFELQPHGELVTKEKKKLDTKPDDQDDLVKFASLEIDQLRNLIELATTRYMELNKAESVRRSKLPNPWEIKGAPELVVQESPKPKQPSRKMVAKVARSIEMDVPQEASEHILQRMNPDLEQIRRVFSEKDKRSQAWLLFNLQKTVYQKAGDDRFFGIELDSNRRNPGYQTRSALKMRKNAAGKVVGKYWENLVNPIRIKHPDTPEGKRSQMDYELTWDEFNQSGKDWCLVFNLLTEWYPSCISICKVCERIGSEEDIVNHLPKSGICVGKKSMRDCWHGRKCQMETCVFNHPKGRFINFASKGKSCGGCCSNC